jgi:predicted secreted protein
MLQVFSLENQRFRKRRDESYSAEETKKRFQTASNRTCTPAASVAIRRYIEEGSKISRDLTARYAN